MPISGVQLILVVLAACELRWRFAWLRVVLVLLTVVQLGFATGTGPAYRRALTHKRLVVLPAAPGDPPQLASEFVSGVLVMQQEVRQDLADINFPLAMLAWLALYPAVLSAVSRRRGRPNRDSDTLRVAAEQPVAAEVRPSIAVAEGQARPHTAEP